MEKIVLEVNNVSKKYGKLTAVDNVSFTVGNNTIMGFLGPNGAGKSTIMNIITGSLSPTLGTVKIMGADIETESIKAKKNVGYLSEIPPLYGDLTVDQYLEFITEAKLGNYKKYKDHVQEKKKLLGIADMGSRLIRNLSKGYKQRVGFVQALIGDPPLIILDEPTVGLDPKQIVEFRKLMLKLKKKHTVLLSSHTMSEINAVCDDVLIINKGKTVAKNSIENLSAEMGSEKKLLLRTDAKQSSVYSLLCETIGTKNVHHDNRDSGKYSVFIIDAEDGYKTNREISTLMMKAGYNILELQDCSMSLEDIFLKLTK